jgi:hypothetical protein
MSSPESSTGVLGSPSHRAIFLSPFSDTLHSGSKSSCSNILKDTNTSFQRVIEDIQIPYIESDDNFLIDSASNINRPRRSGRRRLNTKADALNSTTSSNDSNIIINKNCNNDILSFSGRKIQNERQGNSNSPFYIFLSVCFFIGFDNTSSTGLSVDLNTSWDDEDDKSTLDGNVGNSTFDQSSRLHPFVNKLKCCHEGKDQQASINSEYQGIVEKSGRIAYNSPVTTLTKKTIIANSSELANTLDRQYCSSESDLDGREELHDLPEGLIASNDKISSAFQSRDNVEEYDNKIQSLVDNVLTNDTLSKSLLSCDSADCGNSLSIDQQCSEMLHENLPFPSSVQPSSNPLANGSDIIEHEEKRELKSTHDKSLNKNRTFFDVASKFLSTTTLFHKEGNDLRNDLLPRNPMSFRLRSRSTSDILQRDNSSKTIATISNSDHSFAEELNVLIRDDSAPMSDRDAPSINTDKMSSRILDSKGESIVAPHLSRNQLLTSSTSFMFGNNSVTSSPVDVQQSTTPILINRTSTAVTKDSPILDDGLSNAISIMPLSKRNVDTADSIAKNKQNVTTINTERKGIDTTEQLVSELQPSLPLSYEHSGTVPQVQYIEHNTRKNRYNSDNAASFQIDKSVHNPAKQRLEKTSKDVNSNVLLREILQLQYTRKIGHLDNITIANSIVKSDSGSDIVCRVEELMRAHTPNVINTASVISNLEPEILSLYSPMSNPFKFKYPHIAADSRKLSPGQLLVIEKYNRDIFHKTVN